MQSASQLPHCYVAITMTHAVREGKVDGTEGPGAQGQEDGSGPPESLSLAPIESSGGNMSEKGCLTIDAFTFVCALCHPLRRKYTCNSLGVSTQKEHEHSVSRHTY